MASACPAPTQVAGPKDGRRPYDVHGADPMARSLAAGNIGPEDFIDTADPEPVAATAWPAQTLTQSPALNQGLAAPSPLVDSPGLIQRKSAELPPPNVPQEGGVEEEGSRGGDGKEEREHGANVSKRSARQCATRAATHNIAATHWIATASEISRDNAAFAPLDRRTGAARARSLASTGSPRAVLCTSVTACSASFRALTTPSMVFWSASFCSAISFSRASRTALRSRSF